MNIYQAPDKRDLGKLLFDSSNKNTRLWLSILAIGVLIGAALVAGVLIAVLNPHSRPTFVRTGCGIFLAPFVSIAMITVALVNLLKTRIDTAVHEHGMTARQKNSVACVVYTDIVGFSYRESRCDAGLDATLTLQANDKTVLNLQVSCLAKHVVRDSKKLDPLRDVVRHLNGIVQAKMNSSIDGGDVIPFGGQFELCGRGLRHKKSGETLAWDQFHFRFESLVAVIMCNVMIGEQCVERIDVKQWNFWPRYTLVQSRIAGEVVELEREFIP